MQLIKQRSMRFGILMIVTLWILFQIRQQYLHSKRNESLAAGVTGLPSNGAADNDTNGQVPGNPHKALSDAKVLFTQIETYRRYHQNAYPASAYVLWKDKFENYQQYGYKTPAQTYNPFANPDSRFSDDPEDRARPDLADPFIIVSRRPDGTPVGSTRGAGKRDVIAMTMLYYHENIRHFNGFRDTINPVGFFIVVWDDGEVEQIPYNKLYFIKDGDRYTYGFPGQAGVPAGAILYDQFYRHVPRPQSSGNDHQL